MAVYLELASFIYLTVILIFHLKKRKVDTIEIRAYTAMIITAVLVCLSDAISTLYGMKYPDSIVSEILIKWKLICMSLEMLFCTYYIFCVTSKKSAGIIDFDEHPNKWHFQKYAYIMILCCIAATLATIFGELTVTMTTGEFEYTGSALTACHIATVGSAICWFLMFLKVIKDIRNKKYRTLQMLLIVGGITITVTILFPLYSFSTPAIAFVTAVIFFTMENPDATLITKLNKAKTNAEDANEAKTNFLSSMSHEIRTPLNAIVGFGQALSKEDISGTAKEEVQDILMASNTLLDIVNGILDIQKIESNKIELVNGEYNTKKMISEITSLINARIGSKPLDLKIIIDENLPDVLYGDQMRVKQVMINLLTNAVKYTEEGRILFQIRATNNEDISTLEIQVQDTGIGMTEEAIEQLFTRFQRFDVEKNVNIEGTGLGMAITKGLVELMNGEIKVKSTYGEGTTFTVTLEQKIVTQKLSTEEEEENNKEVKAFNASGQSILVVDDNKINLKVAERLLNEYKVTVEKVMSGSECIDKILDGNKYDLIFMDIMMPKMNGIETLENLKNIVGFKMPVVALTADVISGMEDKYIDEGFDDCLAKPIVEEELYYMLRKFLKETGPMEPSTPKEAEEIVAEQPKVEEPTPVVEIAHAPVAEPPAPTVPKVDLPQEIELPTVALKEEVVEIPVVKEQPIVEETKNEETTTTEIEVTIEPGEPHTVELLKNNKIDVDAGLDLLKDMEMYEMTLEEFYNELQNKLTDLENFKNEGNMDDYAILAHALKTEARYVGCTVLGDMAYEHELAGKDKNQDLVNQKFAELKTEANRIYEVVKKYFS